MKRKARRFGHPTRPETRLLLPPPNDIHAGDDELKSMIDSCLVPLLVDEYVREQARQLRINSSDHGEENVDREGRVA